MNTNEETVEIKEVIDNIDTYKGWLIFIDKKWRKIVGLHKGCLKTATERSLGYQTFTAYSNYSVTVKKS